MPFRSWTMEDVTKHNAAAHELRQQGTPRTPQATNVVKRDTLPAPAPKTPPQGLILPAGTCESDYPQTVKKSLVLVVKGKLPTWNSLLAANHWKRAKIRHEIHERVFASIAAASGCATPMECQGKPRLTR